jgi:hypothetical protein
VKYYFKKFLFLLFFAVSLRIILGFIQYFYPELFTSSIIDTGISGFFLISLLVLVLFINASQKDAEKRIAQTLLAISLKAFLSMVFALVYFLVFKKKDIATVLLFFVLYLGFTLFVVFSLLNMIKKESLKKREI